jgi:3-keto-disaccharide hydrolase
MKSHTICALSFVILSCAMGAALLADDNTDGIAQIRTNVSQDDTIRPLRVDTALIDDTAQNFVPLFDGKTLNGWIQRGGKAKYAVKDGMIVGSTVPDTTNSFLCTEKDYGDFILELDYKVDPELNSGVQFRSECFDKPTTVKSGDKEIKIAAGRVHGYQCEIDMDAKKARWWTAGIYDEGRRLWLYPGSLGGDNKKFTEQGAKISKPNQWNHLRIEALGDSMKTWLNGEPRSEIKDFMTPKGFIALQVHAVGSGQEPLNVYFKDRLERKKFAKINL